MVRLHKLWFVMLCRENNRVYVVICAAFFAQFRTVRKEVLAPGVWVGLRKERQDGKRIKKNIVCAYGSNHAVVKY